MKFLSLVSFLISVLCFAFAFVRMAGEAAPVYPVSMSPDGRFEVRVRRIDAPPEQTETRYEWVHEVVDVKTGEAWFHYTTDWVCPYLVAWSSDSTRCAISIAIGDEDTELILLNSRVINTYGEWKNDSRWLKDMLPLRTAVDPEEKTGRFSKGGIIDMMWKGQNTLLCRYIWDGVYCAATVSADRDPPAISASLAGLRDTGHTWKRPYESEDADELQVGVAALIGGVAGVVAFLGVVAMLIRAVINRFRTLRVAPNPSLLNS
jgi:hypothetical protein